MPTLRLIQLRKEKRLRRSNLPFDRLMLIRMRDAAPKREQRRAERERRHRQDVCKISFLLNPESTDSK